MYIVNKVEMLNKVKKYFIMFFFKKENSELQQISEALENERVLIMALMDNSTDRIYFKDKNSRFLRINKSLAQHFNIKDTDSALGKTDFDFFSQEHAQQAFNDEQWIIETGNSINKEEKETWEGKSASWVSTIKMPLFDKNGKIIGTFGTSRDITDRVIMEQQLLENSEEISAQNEELLQINEELRQTNEVLADARLKAEESDKLKTAILQNISHEIRTPLNAIMGFTKLMPLVLDQKENLEKYSRIIVQSGENLLSIINNLFDAAKIDSGQLKIRSTEFKLDTLFSDIVAYFKEYQRRTNKQHIELIIEENSDFSNLSICSDAFRLKQILTNLIENAFKFTEKGKIIIGCKLILNSAEEYIFSVKDTGIGIEAEKLSYIFEPFTQIELSISRKYSGTGLGLSIAKGLVNLLGGKIWVESEVNKGSSFYFSLPV